MNATYADERVLILAPIAHDAPAMAAVLKEQGLQSQTCGGAGECAERIRSGAGALIMTEEALESARFDDVLQALEAQPPWSELPLIVLTSGGESRLVKLLDVAAAAVGTVTVLERPIQTRTLGRSVEVALRSRRRQYQARELFTQLANLNQTLEQRVVERTAEAVDRAEKLRLLSAELSLAEERERRRIAQVLHDDLQQLLVAARMHFAMLCKASGIENRDGIEQEIAEALDRSFELTRSLSVELAPPILYETGLASALEWLGRQTQKQHAVPVTVDLDHSADPKSTDLRVFLFRSVREIVLNALKHASGQPVHICLTRSIARSEVRLVVSDTGTGFEVNKLLMPPAGGLGLFNIRERVGTFGGSLHIDSAPGHGTKVTITVPCAFVGPVRRSSGRPRKLAVKRPKAEGVTKKAIGTRY
jgi:signal transduction histidine kinase